jgi:hypothetical protein
MSCRHLYLKAASRYHTVSHAVVGLAAVPDAPILWQRPDYEIIAGFFQMVTDDCLAV